MAEKYFLDFCSFLSGVSLASVPESVVDHARLVLLDTLGVIIAGSRNREAGKIAKTLCLTGDQDRTATCPGRQERFNPLEAALINGISGSSLEYEEGNSRAMGHPAIQVVPAVVAACESENLTGESLLRGLIAGYEAASRISRAASIRKGLHPTGTWGVVGCALGVGCAFEKKPEDLAEISNIAASFALSPYVKNSFVGKNVAATFAGVTNYLGLLANLFFDSGIRADEDSFKMTFSRFVSDDFNPDFLYDNLGKEYAIAENYFKPYPTCRFTHPSLEALKAILEKEQVNPDDVDRIKVLSFRAAVHTSSSPPSNAEAMRFSTPYLVATMLVYGNISLGTLKDQLIEDRRIKDLAAKVKMIHSPEYDILQPTHNPAKVTVQLKDGREFTHEILDCRGDPLNPLSGEEISQKFLSLAGPVIGDKRAEQFLEKLKGVETEECIPELIALLRPVQGSKGKGRG